MNGASIGAWLTKCRGGSGLVLHSWRDVGRGNGCRVWECDVGGEALLLKLYSPGFDDYSLLGPVDTARKHALALDELPRFGVPTPRCLGFAADGDEAALVMARLTMLPFTPVHRLEAARILARLHVVQLSDLSLELAGLVSRSTPNRGRVGDRPDEPPLREIALQHGDYFSVNLAATADGPHVLDWDLLALGDAMWDLGFLLEADRNVGEQEAREVCEAYQDLRPIAEERLTWQRRCWRAFWEAREERRSQR